MPYPPVPQSPVIIMTGTEPPQPAQAPNPQVSPSDQNRSNNPFTLPGCRLIAFADRCKAAGIDAGLVCALASFMVTAAHLLRAYVPQDNLGLDDTLMTVILVALPFVVSWLYYAGLEGSPTQATVGKLFVDARVRTIDGKPIGFIRASMRFLVKALTVACLPVVFVSVLLAYRFERRQAIHDLIARTLVVARDSK